MHFSLHNFYALNRHIPDEGFTPGCKHFDVLLKAPEWLDNEEEVLRGGIHKELFLRRSTADGSQVTLKSVRELSLYLLEHSGFKYVLAAKMNQDPLECFFGIL